MKNVIKNLSFVLSSLPVIMCGFSTAAYADVIDFENYEVGRIIDSEYSSILTVSTVNANYGPDAGVIFDTHNPTGNDFDLGGPFNTLDSNLENNYDPGNVFIIQENNTCDADFCSNPDDEGLRNAGTFYFDFLSAVTLESIDFFDVEVEENTKNSIRLFDINNNEIMPNIFSVPDTGGDNMWGQLVFNIEGVKRIELNMGGSGAIDNIRYTEFNENPVTVPVPAAAWLFGSGLLGLVGFARRR